MAKEKLEFELKGNVSDFTRNITAAKGSITALSAAIKESSSGVSIGKNSTAELRKIKTEAEALLRVLDKFKAAGKINISELTPKQRSTVSGGVLAYKETVKSAQPSNVDSKATKEREQEERKLARAEAARAKEEKGLQREANATAKADDAASKGAQNRAITLRYALYDVASFTRTAADAMLNFSGAVVQAGIAQQTAFSQVEKTQVGVDPARIEELRKSLQQLSTEIPVTFAELSKLSMLGAQLGIDSSSLDEFSATVAKFSTVTGVTIEDAALKFGKLSTLLDVPASQFDKLASSIAFVGVNGASTEAAILSTAQQIAAVASAAGFTTTQVVGLASAMASLGISPEEARGVLIPTFQEMDKAVLSFNETTQQGSERLGVFASIAGMSAEDFVSKWGDKASGGAGAAFTAFTEGLGKNSDQISRALAQLGLDGNRTSKGLTALGNNYDFVFRQMADASEGFGNDFLGDAFAKTADDVSAKLEMLNASFDNLMASVGGNTAILGFLGILIDQVKNLNIQMKGLLEASPTVTFLLTLATAAIAVTGGIAALATVMLTARAGFFALQTAFYTSGGAATTLSGSIVALIGTLFGIGPGAAVATTGLAGVAAAETAVTVSSTVATGAVAALGVALRAIPIIALIGGLIWLIDETVKFFGATNDATDASVDNAKAAKEQADALKQLRQELIDNVDMALQGTDDYLRFQGALYSFGKGLQDTKNNFDATTAAGKTNMDNLRTVISAMTTSANGDAKLLSANLAGLRNALILAGITAGPAMEMIATAIAGTEETVAAVVLNVQAMNNGLKGTEKQAGRTTTALERLIEALDKVFRPMETTLDVQKAMDDLGASLAKNGKAFGYSTESMRDNFSSLKDLIYAFAQSSEGDLKKFSGNLLALRSAMVKLGVTSPTAFAEIDRALKASNTKAKVSAKDIAKIYAQISGALVEEQKKNIRTMGDYISDLSGVLNDAFANRYDSVAAYDSIDSAFNSIRESADAAKKSIDDANQSISETKASKSILEYQLSVAVKYGDTLRAESIKAKIAKLNDTVAEKEAEITKAKAEQSKSLKGNSKAAIENRSTIRDLISSGNDYLLTLAKSGMSSEKLQEEAQKLANDFLDQGTQLGFAKTELEAYTKAFSGDFITVIKGLDPYKQIDIEVNSDPALEALSVFVNDVNNKLAEIKAPTIDIPVSYSAPSVSGGGIGGGGTGGGAPSAAASAATAAKLASESALKADKIKLAQLTEQLSTLKAKAATEKSKLDAASYVFWNVNSSQASLDKVRALEYGLSQIAASIGIVTGSQTSLKAKIAKNNYATGGYVSGAGTSTSDSIPANLSNGEYVLKANAVKYYGLDFMNSLNQMQVQRGAQSGGAVGGSSVVYLSPEDRQLLRAAVDRPIALYTENTKIAQSANAGNVLLAQRGTN